MDRGRGRFPGVAAGLVFVAILAAAPRATGQIAVTLTARDSLGMPIRAPVEPGSRVRVDIALSIDTLLINAEPIPDLRILQFDFASNGDALRLGTFRWLVDFTTYPKRSETLPRPSAESTATSPTSNLITLTDTERIVATVEVTVLGRGTLNVVGSTTDTESIGAQFEAGFDPPRLFTLFNDKVSGGTLQIVVTGADRDGDGIPDATDAFPDDPDESVDTDEDGVGNNADTDDDGDDVPDSQDAFPLDPAESTDSDDDGVGDNADPFPNDPAESKDTDGDGMGNNTDTDDDNDGAADLVDAFPEDPTEQTDSNNNGIGDNAERDTNTGPRVTGGVCGSGIAGAAMILALTLCAKRMAPRRARLRVPIALFPTAIPASAAHKPATESGRRRLPSP